MIRLGVIGMGRRSAHLTAILQQLDSEVQLSAVADPSPEAARFRLAEVKVTDFPAHIDRSAEALLERSSEIDALMIGSNCDSHAAIGVACAAVGLPLFMEKPVAISRSQLEDLAAAFAGRESNVVVSFPLRMTPLFQRVLQIVRSGRLGVINQVQAFNYVPYGGVYFTQWYRDYEVTGGLWLQKATHDFDYINQLVQAAPVSIAAVGSHLLFGGEMPPDMRCSTCDRTETCLESPRWIAERGDDGGMGYEDHACAFSSSIRHHDAGSALITYNNGAHVAYSQNFATRRSAASRGARVTGYRGTLQFDWYKDSITVVDHHSNLVDEIKATGSGEHHGGDTVLMRNFLDVIRQLDLPHTSLADGILSASMCVAAQSSEENGTFELVVPPTFAARPV
jgi:predicted dehydrogenase